MRIGGDDDRGSERGAAADDQADPRGPAAHDQAATRSAAAHDRAAQRGPAAQDRFAQRTHPSPLEAGTLLREMWQISHYGWIVETTLRRGLTLGHRELSLNGLNLRLRQLLEGGYVEERRDAGERYWRLSDLGRKVARGEAGPVRKR